MGIIKNETYLNTILLNFSRTMASFVGSLPYNPHLVKISARELKSFIINLENLLETF